LTIFVDRPRWPARGTRWAHVVCDGELTELHEFAAQVGIDRRAFHGDHYDVPLAWWQSVVDAGAEVVASKDIVAVLKSTGLR
jgi:hypothetical protein